MSHVRPLGHAPSWHYRIPDGWALCLGCWRPITVGQLGRERCPRLAEQAAICAY